MTPQEILAKAADVIEQRGWTRGRYARDKHGQETDFDSPDAVSFCVVGAIFRVGSLEQHSTFEAELLLSKALRNEIAWNDSPTQTRENVVKTLRELAQAPEVPQ